MYSCFRSRFWDIERGRRGPGRLRSRAGKEVDEGTRAGKSRAALEQGIMSGARPSGSRVGVRRLRPYGGYPPFTRSAGTARPAPAHLLPQARFSEPQIWQAPGLSGESKPEDSFSVVGMRSPEHNSAWARGAFVKSNGTEIRDILKKIAQGTAVFEATLRSRICPADKMKKHRGVDPPRGLISAGRGLPGRPRTVSK